MPIRHSVTVTCDLCFVKTIEQEIGQFDMLNMNHLRRKALNEGWAIPNLLADEQTYWCRECVDLSKKGADDGIDTRGISHETNF